MPQASKIMIIRHAEKPDGNNLGVTETGEASKHDLIVRGWQRAGALVCYFAPQVGRPQNAPIAQPQFLFASAPGQAGADTSGSGDETKSNRPLETVLPLSRKLTLQINTSFTKGQESEVASAAQACDGAVLIAWQHEAINKIVKSIPGSHQTLPANWPAQRFDIVYVLDLDTATGEYQFSQVAQCVLDGDEGELIALVEGS